ncbi:MAG TPA: hypothetical protein VE398_18525 [Acidobacteriota bacterium]|nr:hypothetical protein [Acidobacteriota bacterium]
MTSETIKVTQKDIDDARPHESGWSDPIQLVIFRLFDIKMVVNSAGASSANGAIRINFPDFVGEKLNEWNLNRRMIPFEFEVELKIGP